MSVNPQAATIALQAQEIQTLRERVEVAGEIVKEAATLLHKAEQEVQRKDFKISCLEKALKEAKKKKAK